MLAYLADSGSFLVLVLSVLFIHISFQAKGEIGNRKGLFKEIAQGLRFLWEQPLLRVMVVLTTVINFLQSPLDLILIVLARGSLHSSVQALGFLLSAGGVGGVLGGLLAPWLRGRLRFGHVVIGSVIIWALAGLLLAFAPSMQVLMLGKFLVSFTWPVYGVTLVSYRLSLTPDELQGPVNSAFRFLSYGREPLGAAGGGMLLVAVRPRLVLWLVAAGFVLSLLAISRTEVRNA